MFPAASQATQAPSRCASGNCSTQNGQSINWQDPKSKAMLQYLQEVLAKRQQTPKCGSGSGGGGGNSGGACGDEDPVVKMIRQILAQLGMNNNNPSSSQNPMKATA